MNRKQKICLWVGIAAIVAMGLYPPWVLESEKRNYLGGSGESRRFEYRYTTKPGPYSWIGNPPIVANWKGETQEVSKFVDLYRLGIQYFVVAVVTAGLILTFRDKSPITVAHSDALKVNRGGSEYEMKKPVKKLLMFILLTCTAMISFALGVIYNYVRLNRYESERTTFGQNNEVVTANPNRYLHAAPETNHPQRRVDLSDLVEQAKNSEPNKQ